MLFDSLYALLRIALAAITAYTTLIVLLRISGKRSLAKLNAFDFVITIALGSTFASFVLSKDVAFADGILAIALLLGLQYALSRASIVFPVVKRLVRSEPRVLLRDGQFDGAALRHERVTKDEALAAIRKHGIGKLEDVRVLVLETDGSFSVIGNQETGELTALDDVRGAGPSAGVDDQAKSLRTFDR